MPAGSPRLNAMPDPNSVPAIRGRIATGRVGWGWPLAMTLIRLPLILFGLAIAFAIYVIGGADHPFLAALLTASLVTVIVNLVSIALLRRLTLREGIAFGDLIGFDRTRLWSDIGWGLALLIVLNVPFVAAILVGAVLLGGVPGGADFGTAMSSVFAGPLVDASIVPGVPAWVAVVAAILFPLLNPIVEEMHYRGYVQPRLEALSGSSRFAIALMAAGFALQHITYALSISGTIVYAVAFLVWGIGAGIVYARMRRLTSLVVVHAVINASTAVVPLIFLLAG